MKTTILIFGLFLCSLVSASAQTEFKSLRVDGGIGWGVPLEKDLSGGFTFYIEPKYEVINKLALGLRLEGAFFGGEGFGLSSGYMVTGDYYLNNNNFRPFVGAGLGVNEMGSITLTDDDKEIEMGGGAYLGALIRTGFDVKHFRATLSYNYGGKMGSEIHHYVGLTVGFYIGGGRN
jgi:hypothetical protein